MLTAVKNISCSWKSVYVTQEISSSQTLAGTQLYNEGSFESENVEKHINKIEWLVAALV